MSERFQSYQMQQRATAAVSCHGLDHAGSLRKAAGSGGGRMGAVCCARSRCRGSSSRIDPAFCLLWQLYAGLLSVRPPPSSCRFDPSVAILHSSLPGRSHLTEHRWSRTETATGNPLVTVASASVSMSCHCCESPFCNSICDAPLQSFTSGPSLC